MTPAAPPLREGNGEEYDRQEGRDERLRVA